MSVIRRTILCGVSILALSSCMSRTEAPVVFHGASDGITREIKKVLEKEPAFGTVIEKYKWIFPKSEPQKQTASVAKPTSTSSSPSTKTASANAPKTEQKPVLNEKPPTAEAIKAEQKKVIEDLNDLKSATPAGTFIKPLNGKVISTFGPKADGQRNDGINIKAERGTDVKAAQNGEVIYASDELAGFGNLVLIRHEKSFITAYAHLQKINVTKGQIVHQGQDIGTVGSSGRVATPQLHFEIRSGAKPLDPRGFISF